jgi:hypothetical protein
MPPAGNSLPILLPGRRKASDFATFLRTKPQAHGCALRVSYSLDMKIGGGCAFLIFSLYMAGMP